MNYLNGIFDASSSSPRFCPIMLFTELSPLKYSRYFFVNVFPVSLLLLRNRFEASLFDSSSPRLSSRRLIKFTALYRSVGQCRSSTFP